jgi:hypothetical protein
MNASGVKMCACAMCNMLNRIANGRAHAHKQQEGNQKYKSEASWKRHAFNRIANGRAHARQQGKSETNLVFKAHLIRRRVSSTQRVRSPRRVLHQTVKLSICRSRSRRVRACRRCALRERAHARECIALRCVSTCA